MDNTEDTVALSVAEEFFGKKQIKLSRILDKGFENRMYIATTQQEKKIVRLSAEDSLETYALESVCMSAASAIGIPCPKVLQLGRKKIDDLEYSFMVET